MEWQTLGSLERRLRACLSGIRAEMLPYGSPSTSTSSCTSRGGRRGCRSKHRGCGAEDIPRRETRLEFPHSNNPGEETMSAGHAGHIDPANKERRAAHRGAGAVLAFSETLGKAAQTSALASHIEASNLWSFFQAKTIRQNDGAHRRGGDGSAVRGKGAGGREEADRTLEEDRGALSV